MNSVGIPPFGSGFEINSALSFEALRSAIRSKKKPMFDMRSGPRGWILGPLICLWLSPYWSMGPGAVGLISRNDSASRVVGLAGFDPAGSAMLLVISLIAPLLIGLSGIAGFGFSMLALVLFPAGGVLIMWSRAQFHHEAEPIVRFLETIGRPAPRQGQPAGSVAVPLQRPVTLTIDGEEQAGLASWEEICAALEGLGSDGFMILAEGPETYIQLLRVGDEFVLEKREGDRRSHFRATRREGHAGRSSAMGPTFSIAEARAVLAAHTSGSPKPDFVTWEKLRI